MIFLLLLTLAFGTGEGEKGLLGTEGGDGRIVGSGTAAGACSSSVSLLSLSLPFDDCGTMSLTFWNENRTMDFESILMTVDNAIMLFFHSREVREREKKASDAIDSKETWHDVML